MKTTNRRTFLATLSITLALGACGSSDELTAEEFDDLVADHQKADSFAELVRYAGLVDSHEYTKLGYRDRDVEIRHEAGRTHFDIQPNIFPGVMFYGNHGEEIGLDVGGSQLFVAVYGPVDHDDQQLLWSERLSPANGEDQYRLPETGLYMAVMVNRRPDQHASGSLALTRSSYPATTDAPSATVTLYGTGSGTDGASRQSAACGISALDTLRSVSVPFRVVDFDCAQQRPDDIEFIADRYDYSLYLGSMNTSVTIELELPESFELESPVLREERQDFTLQIATEDRPSIDMGDFAEHCRGLVSAAQAKYGESAVLAVGCGAIDRHVHDYWPVKTYLNHDAQIWLAPGTSAE